MSSNPNPVQNISDVVSPADLTTWAQIFGVMRYLAEPLDEPGGALSGSPISVTTITNSFQNLYAAARQAGVDPHHAREAASLWSVLKGDAGGLAAFIGELFGFFAQLIFAALAAVWGGMRKGEDWGASQIAAMAMEEVFLTPVDVGLMPTGTAVQDHLTRVTQLGAIVHGVLRGEFAPAQNGQAIPAVEPAERLAGIMVNAGVSSALLGMLGEMVPWLHEDQMHSLLQSVVQNLGMGRLARRALTPLIQILVAKPLEWALNTQYTPTQFSISELINPYAQTAIPHDQIFTAMNLLGYSNDKVQAIIELHQKRFTPAEVLLLRNNSLWDSSTADAYIAKMNYPAELIPNVLTIEVLKEERAWTDRLVVEMESEVKNGNLTLDEFNTIIDGLPYAQNVQAVIKATAAYKVKAHVSKTKVAHLSYAQLKLAFEQGLITMSDAIARWTAQGYSVDDQDILELLLLFDLQKVEAAAAAKAAKAAKKATTSTTTGLTTTTPAAPTTPTTGTTGSGTPTTP